MARDEDLEKINLTNLRIALEERSGGLCEVCFRGDGLVLHHIGRRTKASKAWPEGVRDGWPHNELNAIIICGGAHGAGDRSARVHVALVHNRGALWALLKVRYAKRRYNGQTYEEHFAGPGPWERFLS